MEVTDAWCAFGLGSNLGHRLQQLRAAVEALRQVDGLNLTDVAPLYETEPVDCPPGSPAFLNTVTQGHYTGDVFQLLRASRHIEEQLGRTRQGLRNEARSIDIDLLLVEGITLSASTLTLPHPRMEERLFVLQPLADLRPDLVLSRSRPIAQLIDQLERESTGIQKLDAPL